MRLWHPRERERQQRPSYSLLQLGNNPLQQQSQLRKLAPTHRLFSGADLHSLARRTEKKKVSEIEKEETRMIYNVCGKRRHK